MSVQFAPLATFSAPYAGWYWKECLDEQWTKIDLSAPIADQYEHFEDEAHWARPGIRVAVGPTPPPIRVQITQRDDDRMIQLQQTRFIYNWRKRGDVYPSNRALRPEFDTQFDRFAAFARAAGLGDVQVNQWETTYVNHIQRGALWETPEDWPSVLPDYYVPLRGAKGRRLESFGGEWHLVIEPNRGRLHVAVQHGQVGGTEGTQVLVLQLTARGPIDEEKGWDLDSGLTLGHETIVRSFAQMTSDAAHRHWGRTI